MIALRIDADEVRNALARLQQLAGRPRPILQAAARSVRVLLQRHFTERQQTPNQLGGKRTNFWMQIRTSTQMGEVTDNQATVVIGDSRFAHKVTGGTIRPKNAKWLAIPAVSEAHGRRPEAFSMSTGIGLRFIMMGSSLGALEEVRSTMVTMIKRGKNAGKFKAGPETGSRIIYWLKKSVSQAPDPKAMPAGDALDSAALEGAESYLRTVVQGSQIA